MTAPDPDPKDPVDGCALLVLTILYQPLFAVVVTHGWDRWAAALGAPAVSWVAVFAALMTWFARPRSINQADRDIRKDLMAGLAQYLLLGLAAAVVWGAP